MSIEIIVLRFVHRKSKNLLSLVPFSIIFLVEFCVTIYSRDLANRNVTMSTLGSISAWMSGFELVLGVSAVIGHRT